jgi:PAS domain S-box-containing protein
MRFSPDGDNASAGLMGPVLTMKAAIRRAVKSDPRRPSRRAADELRLYRRSRQLLFQYGSALAAVAAATVVRMLLHPLLGSRAVFAIYYVAVVASAWLGGLGPALCAVGMGGFCALYFFVPLHSQGPAGSNTVVDLVAYLVVGVLAALLSDNQRRATISADENAREVRATKQALQEADRQTVDILESITDAFAAFDMNWNCVRLNTRAAALLGVSRTEMIGTNFWLRFPGLLGTEYERQLRAASDERVSVRFETQHPGTGEWFETQAIPTQTGIAVYFNNVTDRKRHQAEVEALNARLQRAMRETHHRVKNNLQVIEAMVDMQVLEGESTVPTDEVKRIGRHVQSLAALHDLLTEQARQDHDLQHLSSTAVLERLRPTLEATLGGRQLIILADEMVLTIRQSSSLTMLVNELVSNAVKHGSGAITVRLAFERDGACLEVDDEGRGFPRDFDPDREAHTGLNLIDSLSRWDLAGDVRYLQRPGGGARVVVHFPLETSSHSI